MTHRTTTELQHSSEGTGSLRTLWSPRCSLLCGWMAGVALVDTHKVCAGLCTDAFSMAGAALVLPRAGAPVQNVKQQPFHVPQRFSSCYCHSFPVRGFLWSCDCAIVQFYYPNQTMHTATLHMRMLLSQRQGEDIVIRVIHHSLLLPFDRNCDRNILTCGASVLPGHCFFVNPCYSLFQGYSLI